MFGYDSIFHVSDSTITNKESPSVKERFDHLLYLASSFNMRGSCVLINKCYLDGKVYDDDDIREGKISGCMSNYPYNTLQYYYKNEWMFNVVLLLYSAEANVIPHMYHNLPTIFKIKRSDGSIQDAIARDNLDGIRIRKSMSRGDEEDNLYVRVQFIEQTPVLSEEIIKEKMTNSANITYKDVSLQDIVEMNPTLMNKCIIFKINKLVFDKSMPDESEHIYKMANDYYKQWCVNTLSPCLDRYKNKFNLNVVFTF